ncbi:hypothetical protein NSB25_19340 [Acetatifactor muris]|uniref:Uncharacterized protein n=1 Tax=Acetatifactor muris TaxID=879566 RepID=A0A2K4ZER4_9FIRM|nr:hypothetical protein [Acetatifactor muris]MCR2049418.1 hypothetical protein [Acetatifactor muris]SOY28946.1 hypothetical protein AMURIS_01661 [Acetatifactor muris]
MKRRFNITGLCVPDRHYMVDISSRLEEIRKLVEEGARRQKCRRRIFIKFPRGIEIAGRRLFLLYLRPIINGVGNYYVEAQTRDLRRTDVIVDYGGEQYMMEKY